MSDDENKKPRDPLADALNIDSDIELYTPSTEVVEYDSTDHVDEDYEFSRAGIMDAVMKASDALDNMIDLAKASQAARSFEVVATLTKVILDGHKDVMELAKKHKELKGELGTAAEKTVNNNLFVGSSKDLQKFLKGEGIETLTRSPSSSDNIEERDNDGADEG